MNLKRLEQIFKGENEFIDNRVKISNFELEIRFFQAQVEKKITLKNTVWVKKNEIQKIPISSLMRNILYYLNPT